MANREPAHAGHQDHAARRRAAGHPSSTDDTIPADPPAPRPSVTPPAPTSRKLRSLDRWSGERLPILERDHYKLTSEIGRGGIGRVLRAHDRRLDRTVAVKELLDTHGDAEERFVREALITARLQHPSIVPIHEAGRWPNGQPFYTMKLVSGRSLAELIEQARSFDQRLALLPHVLSAAEAIAYAHSKRILHRDLKPANVLIGAFGETVVIDWGLAKDLGEPDAPTSISMTAASLWAEPDVHNSVPARTSAELTMAGTIMGTPAYMAPEQACGSLVDERTDVYALGAILYHVLAGAPPYEGDSGVQILRMSLSEAPRDLSRRQAGVPHDLLTIVRKAMSREPNERYPTAKELADDLRRFQTGQIVAAHSYSRRERARRFLRKHRAAVSVLAAALAVVALVAAASVQRIVTARSIAERERDRAERERDRAEREQAQGDIAKRQAMDRADALVLMQARAEIERDPNKTFAWLKALSPAFERWQSARMLAADAEARGLSRVLRGHKGSINDFRISPDGETAATASDDRTIRLWSLTTGESRVLTGHADEVWGVAFSPREDILASGAKDNTVRLWNLKTGASRVLFGHQQGVERLIFSADGTSLATRDARGGVWLWNVATGAGRALFNGHATNEVMALSPDGQAIAFHGDKRIFVAAMVTGEVRRLAAHDEIINDIEYAPDGSFLATAGSRGEIRLWNLKTGAARRVASHDGAVLAIEISPDSSALYSVGEDEIVRVTQIASSQSRVLGKHSVKFMRLSPDGKLLAVSGGDHTAWLFDLTTGASRALYGFESFVLTPVFSPDSRALGAPSTDHTARLWSLDPASRYLTRHAGGASRAAFLPDSLRVVSAGMDGEVRVSDGDAVMELGGHAGGALDVVASPDGSRVASAGRDGTVRVASLRGDPALVLRASGEVRRVIFSPDGGLIAAAGAGRSVRLWDAATGAVRADFEHTGAVRSLAFSPDGRRLATGGHDTIVRLWTVATGDLRALAGHTGPVLVVTFSPDGKTLASGSEDHTLRLWNTETGASRSAAVGGQGTSRVVFLPGGEAFVSLDSGDTAAVWDVRSLEVRRWLRGHLAPVLDIALSPDGSRAATAGSDKTVRLWDLASGESRVLGSHDDAVTSVEFSPDGKRVASASADGTARRWDDDLPLTPAELRAHFDAATPETVELDASR